MRPRRHRREFDQGMAQQERNQQFSRITRSSNDTNIHAVSFGPFFRKFKAGPATALLRNGRYSHKKRPPNVGGLKFQRKARQAQRFENWKRLRAPG